MTLTIREARRADVAVIAALIRMGASQNPASRPEAEREAAHPDYLRAFDALSASADTLLYVAEQADLAQESDGAQESSRVIGTFQLSIMPGIAERGRTRAKIESVHVDPDFRGQGIGKKMIAQALALAKARGAGIMELSSSKLRTDAHRFYRELGFEQGHEGFKKLL